MLQVFCRAVLLALLLAPLGCGESKPKQYPVSGKVVVNGQPLADVAVYFVPTTGGDKSHNFTGKTGADGSYSLSDSTDQSKGAQAGKYKVVLALSGEAQGKAMMSAMTAPGQTGAAPPQVATPFPTEYTSSETSPKEVEVKAESNTIDITIP